MNRQIGGVILLLLGLVALIGGLRGTWWRAWRALVSPDEAGPAAAANPYPREAPPGNPGSSTPTN